MKGEGFGILLYIAENAGLFKDFKTNTASIAKKFNISQQSASRKLRELEQAGFVNREAFFDGVKIGLSDKGRAFLEERYGFLRRMFEKKKISLKGTIQTGLGEGRYYISLKQYQKQFEDKLDFRAYPGTLNLKINIEDARFFLMSLDKIDIKGFKSPRRTFGSARAYKIKIKDVNGALLLPERKRHEEDILEIIAPVYLREKLNLKDNDVLEVEK